MKANVVFDNKNLLLDVLEKVVTYITTDGMFKKKKHFFWKTYFLSLMINTTEMRFFELFSYYWQ